MFDISRYYQTLFFLVCYQACRCAAPAIFFFPFFPAFFFLLFFVFFSPVHARHTGGSIDQPQRTVLLRRPRERETSLPPPLLFPPSTPGRSYTMASERSVNNGSFPIKNSVCAPARLLRTLLCFSSLFYLHRNTPSFSSSSSSSSAAACPFYFYLSRVTAALRSRTVSGQVPESIFL